MPREEGVLTIATLPLVLFVLAVLGVFRFDEIDLRRLVLVVRMKEGVYVDSLLGGGDDGGSGTAAGAAGAAGAAVAAGGAVATGAFVDRVAGAADADVCLLLRLLSLSSGYPCMLSFRRRRCSAAECLGDFGALHEEVL